jgi:GGDEF domain-containing protein
MAAVRDELDAGRRGVVLMVDVEGLRALDERHGYASGNVILCEVARVLTPRGCAGRLSDDELALWATIAAAEAHALGAAVLADVNARLAERGVALEVTVGTAPACGADDVQAVLDAAAAARQQTRPPYLHTPHAA